MNAIDLLRRDHEEVQLLFGEYSASDQDDIDNLEDLFQKIERALISHSEAEDQIFYAALDQEVPELVRQARNEHRGVIQLLAEMLELEVDDDEFVERMDTLIDLVRSHISEEESTGGLLAVAEQKLTYDQLEGMGRQIQQLKQDSEAELKL